MPDKSRPDAAGMFHDYSVLLDLGMQPVSNRFLTANEEAPRFPLQLNMDNPTGIIFIDTPFPVAEMKPKYDWLTCYEPEDHLDDLVGHIIDTTGLTADSVIGGYSFKDETTLERLAKRGCGNTWIISPEEDLGLSDPQANVETYQALFTREKAAEIRDKRGAVDVFVVRHVVEHAYDLSQFIEAIETLLKPGGYIIWELPDCENALKSGDCTTIWEEHIYYFTPSTFRHLLTALGFEIDYFHSYPYALENSITAIVRKGDGKSVPPADDFNLPAVHEMAANFANQLEQRKSRIRGSLATLAKGKRMAIFGAGHLTVAFISLMGIEDLIDVAIDDNEHKKGKYLPIGGIPIQGSDALYSDDIGICLLGLNPQNQPKVVEKHRAFQEQGGIFMTVFLESLMDDVDPV
jgi:hypothetical protein